MRYKTIHTIILLCLWGSSNLEAYADVGSEAATLFSDARDYTLTVFSEHGALVPSIGNNRYAWRTAVTCLVENASIEDGVNWRNTGWTGAGSVPPTGVTNSIGEVTLTNLESSITWNWETSFAITNVAAAQREGTKLVDITYDIISDVTNAVKIGLYVRESGTPILVSSVVGDVGEAVLPGTNRTFSWDAGDDWNAKFSPLMLTVGHRLIQNEMVEIPQGSNVGYDPDYRDYALTVDAFYMDKNEVTNDKMIEVMQWAFDNGKLTMSSSSAINTHGSQQELLNLDSSDCRITWSGSIFEMKSSKGSGYPCAEVTWYGAAAYCNYRSEMEGKTPCYNLNDWSCDFTANGYRLPTNDEWEYAARGGLSSKRFPWGNTITHDQANYRSYGSYSYDISQTRGYHPDHDDGGYLYTSPSETFAPNGYGLYDMAGNVREWCNTASESYRSTRGGSWYYGASYLRCGREHRNSPGYSHACVGFRMVYCQPQQLWTSISNIVVDTRSYIVNVSSRHGAITPRVGINVYPWHANVTCSVEPSVTSALTNWVSTGWNGSGSIPPEGGAQDIGGIVLTSLTSSVHWNWITNYWLEVSVTGSGSIDKESGWKRANSNVQMHAEASADWLFMGWSGDKSTDHTQDSITVSMVRPVSVTATFSDDADGDGLLNTREVVFKTNPRKKDSDGDGAADPDELIAGTSPTNSISVLAVELDFEGSANGISFFGVSGRFYQIEYIDDLAGEWTPLGAISKGKDAIITEHDSSAGKRRFYRIRVSDDAGKL